MSNMSNKNNIGNTHNKFKKNKKTITNNSNLIIKENNDINKLITSEVRDEATYTHFKSLISASKKLCKGKQHNNKLYKVHIALSKDYASLIKQNHYRIIYIHNNSEIIAYIAVKLYKRQGGFMFIHKICSVGGGYGSKLMNIILKDARDNHIKLGITYISLTTHNLDLVDYYNKFKPTRTEIVNSPGTTKKIPNKVAYMIWQLSPNMPNFTYV